MSSIEFISGWVDVLNHENVPLHFHNCFEMVYFRSGRATVNIENNSYVAYPGTFFIIKETTKHEEIRHELGIKTLCIRFYSDYEFKNEFYTDHSGDFLAIIMSAIDEYTTKLYNHEKIINLRMNELLLLIEREECSDQTISKDFKYAINYIRENCKSKIVFSKLAEALNISYDYFHHRFKEITSYSPQAFLIKNRLEEATKMLKNSDMNCTEIAYYCGFSNSAQFTNMFKKEYSITPTAYRKKK